MLVSKETSWWRRAARLVGVLTVVAGGVWQLSLETRLYLGRVRYPWDIEWLESSWLYQAYRVMHGLSTYGPPREGYLPQLHPTGYPALLGAVGRVVGLDYGMARTLSFLMFLGSGLLVLRALVRKHEGRVEGWALGAFAMGCAAAGAPMVEGFYDLVRADMMAVALCVLGAALVGDRRRMSTRRIVLLSTVLTAVLYTRLPAVFFVGWIGLYVLVRDRRSGVLLGLTAATMGGLVLVALQLASRGWYWMLTVSFLQNHQLLPERVGLGFRMLARFAPFLVPLPLVVGVLAWKRRLAADTVLWVGMLVAAIPAALLPFAKVGGFSNDFLPIAFMIGPGTAFIAADLIAAFRRHPRAELAVQTLIFVAGGVFLGLRTWDVSRFTPTADAFRRARDLNAHVAKLPGGVVASRHPFLAIHNGHDTLQWMDMPYLDMLWANFTDLNLGGYVDKAHPQWALVAGTEIITTTRELSLRFQLEERLPDPPVTLIGERSSMRYLLRANDDEKDGHVLFDFESLDGWTVKGDAFALVVPGTRFPGAIGKHIANSFHPKTKDAAKGTLISPTFVIDRPHMSLRVGGGFHNGTRAELRVAGRAQRTAMTIWEQQETLTRVVWDVTPFQGKEAQLWLIDEDAGSWAHLSCDHVVLY
jgi:hypothetical protein